MRIERPKSVRDCAMFWFDQMKRYTEDAKKDGDIRRAYVACAQLTGGLALASSLRLIRPADIRRWEGYITSESAGLEHTLFDSKEDPT